MCCVARVPEAVVSVTCTARLQACQSLASLLLSSHLIFLSLMRFSLSRFFSALTNWLKKCSWSFFLSTCLKRWSLPYFSENSLKVDLGGEENFIFNWIEIKEHQCRSRWCEGAIWTLSAPPPEKKSSKFVFRILQLVYTRQTFALTLIAFMFVNGQGRERHCNGRVRALFSFWALRKLHTRGRMKEKSMLPLMPRYLTLQFPQCSLLF